QHHVDAQFLVADGLEQDHHRALLVALHGALAPSLVRHARALGERALAGVRLDEAGKAVVAVAARRREALAEVGEHELAPAAAAVRVRAHHLDARAIELVTALLLVPGRS